jgi:LmbE family N-acetylglucosaminyl deacetylase
MREPSRDWLAESALVFAPHPDDETLGCGGTIVRKKEAGATVRVVFMSDGSQSHAGWMDPGRLRELRHREARQAAHVLGLRDDDLVFLDFPDGTLDTRPNPTTARVRELLERFAPAQVFVPYSHDGHADHVATHRIVHDAVRDARPGTAIYEYPIWFWHHWPWVALPGDRPRTKARQARKSLRASRRLWKDFRFHVAIDPVLPSKRRAADQYASQTTRLQPGWPTLGDVSGGEFLECFFGPYETFCGRTP